MPRRSDKSLIGRKLYALIGEVVVAFGQLEDHLRYSVSEHISPGIEVEPGLSLFRRIRFSELIEMYELVVGYVFTNARDLEEIESEEADRVLNDLRLLCKGLSNVNERRNTVVHSSYHELEHVDEKGRIVERTLEAMKPNRKVLDLTEDFKPFEDIYGEARELVVHIGNAQQDLFRFDDAVRPLINSHWESFARRVVRQADAGTSRERHLRYPSVRIGSD